MTKRENKETTRVGYVNKNKQVNLGRTKPPRAGSDHGQYVYVIRCMKCRKNYGANGSDIFERKCPYHQGGKLGLKLLASEIHKTIYYYGSRPANNYDYRCFVKYIAPVLPKNDKVFFHNNSLEWRNNRNEIPIELFRNICHWKSPRRFDEVLNNTSDHVNLRWHDALLLLQETTFENNGVTGALNALTQLRGVEVRMASALLTAWNPDEFGIMDFKVLNVLGMPETYSAEDYMALRNKLLELKNTQPELNNCTLRQIELALWYYYSIQDAGTRTRSDNE